MLDERGLAPKKSLGQNFLVDHNLLRKLVDDARIQPNDTILEVGPGAGVLTRELLDRGARVVAIELDAGLADLLRDTITSDRLTLIEGDALPKGELNPEALAALGGVEWRLVANLPYAIASPLIAEVLIRHTACRSLHVTIQKEVAERLTAQPDTRDYGSLGVLAQSIAEVELITLAGPHCFWPPPKVTSAMASLRRRDEPLTSRPDTFESFVRQLFMKRRKQLGAILGRDAVARTDLDPTRRPQSLSVPEFVTLHEAIEPAQSED